MSPTKKETSATSRIEPMPLRSVRPNNWAFGCAHLDSPTLRDRSGAAPIAASDVARDLVKTFLPMTMPAFPNNEQRLQLLNDAQPERPWHSCDDKRRCIRCERIFRASEVIVTRDVLACPGCRSEPEMWVRTGDPLTDEMAWADWKAAMDYSYAKKEQEDEDDSELFAVQ